jgi:hypothetical protein
MENRNVLIFVADALRDDFLTDSLRELGEYVPTVAAGTNSPAGFASIISGLYPSQHQTHAFSHRLDPEFNYLNTVDDIYDTRFYQAYETTLSEVLGVEQDLTNPISEVDEPFVILERDMTTHAPYDNVNYDDVDIDKYRPEGTIRRLLEDWTPGSGHPYFGGHNVDWERIRSDYESASRTVADRFKRRINQLDNEGVLEDTLVIFTSDHGEILGEYSEMSHGEPLIPELIRVPTVVLHPDETTSGATFMSHTDILPTILDFLDEEPPWTLPGHSIYSDHHQELAIAERRSKPHTLDEFSLQNFYEYHVRSVWDQDGGFSFNEPSFPGKILHAFRQSPLFNPLRGWDALRAFSALRPHISTTQKFGNPAFNEFDARERLNEIDRMNIELTMNETTVSESAKEELRNLGYL